MKFDSMEIVKRFQLSSRNGFYLVVLEEGEVAAGDQIRLLNLNVNGPTIAKILKSDH
jgi:MOSC domain-containing protein YiiM